MVGISSGLRSLNGGYACPPYSKGPYVWNQSVHFTAGISGTLKGAGGYQYYIDEENGSDSNNGLSPTKAFATLEKCFGNTDGNKMARDNYDDDAEYHVFVFPGTYVPTLDLRLYGQGIHLHGLGHPGTDSGVTILATNVTYAIMLVGAANSTIENIHFNCDVDKLGMRLIAADNCVITNCVFKGVHGTTTTAIQFDNIRSTKIYGNQIGEAGGDFTNGIYGAGGADNYCIDCHIAGNRIYSTVSNAQGIYGAASTLVSYGTVIERNFINLTTGASAVAINWLPTGGNMIVDNYCMVPSTATAIVSGATNTGVIGNHTMAGTTAPVDPNEAIS